MFMKLGVVIPYRARKKFLDQFLIGFTDYIESKNNFSKGDYEIILAEQCDDKFFNRGLAINIGVDYALRYNLADYFVFHDIDIIPLSGIDYSYEQTEWWFLCAGGFKIKAEDFVDVNGFSNGFKGWGYEDTDFQERLHLYKKPKFFWPKLGKKNEATMLNLEFGGRMPDLWNLDSKKATKDYFHLTMLRRGAGKWDGFPRYYAPRDLDLRSEHVDKYRSWYDFEQIDNNKARLDRITYHIDSEYKKQNHYENDGFSQIKNFDIIDSYKCQGIHRVGFFTE